jgi:HK97 family phage major capsid protein
VFIQLKQAYFGKAVGERVDVPDEKQARALIEQGVAEAVQGNPLGELIEKQLAASLETLTQSLNDQISEAVRKFAQAQTLSRKNAVPALFGPGGEGDPKRNFGDWCLQTAILGSAKASPQAKSAAAERLEKVYNSAFNQWGQETKAALAEASGATGGYIVPPDFYQQLLAIAAEEATFRSQAFVMPMASATLQFPFLDISTAQTAGNSPFFGGVIANWTSEAQTRTEVEPKFKMMVH